MSAPQGHPKWGGREKGSKNKTTIEKEMALKFMQNKILEKWGDLIDKKIELAEGANTGKPDKESLEYLFSVVIGRPTQRMELEDKGKLNVTVLPWEAFEIYRSLPGEDGLNKATEALKLAIESVRNESKNK